MSVAVHESQSVLKFSNFRLLVDGKETIFYALAEFSLRKNEIQMLEYICVEACVCLVYLHITTLHTRLSFMPQATAKLYSYKINCRIQNNYNNNNKLSCRKSRI